MLEDKPVIVDTNIVFSALLKSRSSFMDFLYSPTRACLRQKLKTSIS